MYYGQSQNISSQVSINKELLDECLSILEVQPIHLISWCQKRMGYFFKACTTCNDILPAVYVMATANIRVEERDIFFTAKNIYTLKLVSHVELFFSRELLRPSDKSNLLVSTVLQSIGIYFIGNYSA